MKKNKDLIFEITVLKVIVLSLTMFQLMVIGALLNQEVTINNGGKMPVLGCYATGDRHFCYQENSEVNLPKLTDRYVIGNYSYSIGDFFIYLGSFGLGGMVIYCIFKRYTITIVSCKVKVT